MSFGKKYFLSRAHDNSDYVTWFENKHTKQFRVHMCNVTVSLHAGDGPDALPKFIYKIEALYNALDALLKHPIGEHCNHRIWLNPEMPNVQHFTGYFAWGYSEDMFYYTLADCQRAIRGQFNYTTRCGASVVKEQFKLLERIAKYLAEAIAYFKKMEEKHV